MARGELLLATVLGSALTLALYAGAKALHRRRPHAWASPVVLVPLAISVLLVVAHVRYATYIAGTRWLVMLLGPALVSFAVPIHAQRERIRRDWPVLAVAVVVGSITAIASSVAISRALGLDTLLRLSLVPRSISTPFAMLVSRQLGGAPDVTAVLVVLTGVVGAVIGEALLLVPALRSMLARGALMGMGAHAVGSARAVQIDPELGAISGLVMVLVGIVNVLAAPLLVLWGVGR